MITIYFIFLGSVQSSSVGLSWTNDLTNPVVVFWEVRSVFGSTSNLISVLFFDSVELAAIVSGLIKVEAARLIKPRSKYESHKLFGDCCWLSYQE